MRFLSSGKLKGDGRDIHEEIHRSNSSHKTGSTNNNCSFLINMPKNLSTSNVGIFLNNSVLSQSLMHMGCQKRSPLLAFLQKDHILLDQSFLMTMTSATWRLPINSTSEKNGLLLNQRTYQQKH